MKHMDSMRSYRRYKGKSPQNKKRHWLAALLVLLIAGVLAFGALELVIYRGAGGQTAQTDGSRTVMVIFGCQVRKDGPSILLRDRLDTALAYWEDHPDIKIVVSGGKGDDEHMSEAQCMYDYLTAHGVDGDNILKEDRSRNTCQNINNTLNLLWNDPVPWEWEDGSGLHTPDSYVLVSSDFHLSRILMLWKRAAAALNGDPGRLVNVTTLPAPCSHLPSRVQMFFREPLALVKSFIFDRDFNFSW